MLAAVGGRASIAGVRLSGSVFMYAEDQQGRAGGSAASHPFAAQQGGMKRCGRSRAGSIKRATTPETGVMTNNDHAPLLRPNPAHPAPAASDLICPSRKP